MRDDEEDPIDQAKRRLQCYYECVTLDDYEAAKKALGCPCCDGADGPLRVDVDDEWEDLDDLLR